MKAAVATVPKGRSTLFVKIALLGVAAFVVWNLSDTLLLIRSVVDRVVVSPAEEKPKSPFDRRAMKVEIIGGLDALLSNAATGGFTSTPVREGGGSGGGT